MKRILACCLLLSLSGALYAAPPPASTSTSTQATSDAAIQQQMAALQARMNALAARMATLSSRIGDQANASALRYLADSKRGMFGMAVSPEHGQLHVDAVTPGGPAERAGLQAGDVITAINGTRVSPHHASLLADLATLPSGQPARLSVTREHKSLSFNVTPERLQAEDWQAAVRAAEQAAEQATARLRSPHFRQQLQQNIEAATRAATMQAGAWQHAWRNFAPPWWGLNLAPLNPDLGRYFGTRHGVLVLSRNDQQFPELQPGDVILQVGGKRVAQPEDVQRALHDAAAAQHTRATLRRHGKTITLTLNVPPRGELLPPPPPPAPPIAPPPPVAPPPPAAPPPPVAPPPPASATVSA